MNRKKIKINNITISDTSRPFIVAEAGVNYYDIAKKENIGLTEAAELMIREAAKAGANAIKFQTYKAKTLASKYSPAYWDLRKEPITSQYELFKKFDKLTKKNYQELANFAKKQKIIFMSTPFSREAVDFLTDLVPAFKIASADITNFPLLRQIGKKKKPIFLSTGASTIEEIKEALKIIEEEGNDQVVLLHCVLNYPTKNRDANLKMITGLQRTFPNYLIGYSDHTLPDKNMTVLTTSYILGARVIEKHFTLDKSIKGNDHFHSMDPNDLRTFKNNVEFLEKILGKAEKTPLKSEKISINYARRSLVANRELPQGKKISFRDIAIKRPGTGISPKFLNEIIGKKTKRKIKEDEIIKWKDLF